jgi:hypothetical protein
MVLLLNDASIMGAHVDSLCEEVGTCKDPDSQWTSPKRF